MKIDLNNLRCGEYYISVPVKIEFTCDDILEAQKEKRFNKTPFLEYMAWFNSEFRKQNPTEEELKSEVKKYHIERIALLIEGKEWHEPILITNDFKPGGEYIDGGHRVWAAKCANIKEIEAIIVNIDQKDWNQKKGFILHQVNKNNGDWLKAFDSMGIGYSQDKIET